jgi:hypothetical protein
MKKKIIYILLAALCLFFGAMGQNITINSTQILSGTVTDPAGVPLPGATVKVAGSIHFATTDKDGRFMFTNLSSSSGILTVTFIGYQPIETKFSLPANLIIVLKAVLNPLNEVQIVGYGTTTKRLNTGSTSTVTADDIEKQPVTNPLAALQGQAPGVLVQTQNGLPGGNIKVQIRGQGSLSSGTDPLFIVDGVPFLTAPLYGVGSANGALSMLKVQAMKHINQFQILPY